MSINELIKNHLFFWTLVLVGCGTLVGNPEDDDDEVSNGTDDVAQPQALTINIADAPVDNAKSLFITIAAIDIKKEGGDWVNIPLVLQQEIDLLQYQNGDSAKFAEIQEIAAGTYSETRLILSAETTPRLVLSDDKTYDLNIPSDTSSGIKIKIPFTVEAGQPVDLTLDFDVRQSLKKTGEGDSVQYSLNPVLRLLKHGEYGHIEGEAPDGKVVCVYAESVQPDESDSCEHAANSALVKDGKYKLPHLPKGKYKIKVFDSEGKPTETDSETPVDVEPAVYKDLKGKGKGNDKSENEENDSDEDENDDDEDNGKPLKD